MSNPSKPPGGPLFDSTTRLMLIFTLALIAIAFWLMQRGPVAGNSSAPLPFGKSIDAVIGPALIDPED